MLAGHVKHGRRSKRESGDLNWVRVEEALGSADVARCRTPSSGWCDVKGLRHIVVEQLEALAPQQMLDTQCTGGEEIVHSENLVPTPDEEIARCVPMKPAPPEMRRRSPRSADRPREGLSPSPELIKGATKSPPPNNLEYKSCVGYAPPNFKHHGESSRQMNHKIAAPVKSPTSNTAGTVRILSTCESWRELLSMDTLCQE